MINLLRVSTWQLPILACLVGGLAMVNVSAFLSVPQPALPSIKPQTGALEGDYRLDWQSTTDESGRSLLPDEVFAYSAFLKQALSGQLGAGDPRRIELQARASLTLAPEKQGQKRSIRLQSRVRPQLVLRNHSLAVFEVETDHLYVRYSDNYARLLEDRIETIKETIRIADTRLGLVVRHIETLKPPVAFVFAQNDQAPDVRRLGGVNYYPASAPWSDFWSDFPVEEITADFAQIRALGANTVRVFLNRQAFEAPAGRAQSLRRLERLLDLAEAHDLRVILTCFDMGVNYDLSSLTQNWAHLQRILELAERHPAVALVDLKNEPDLDYRTWGAARVDVWLSTLLTLAQATYPDMAFTIGWSRAEATSALAEQVDVVSFHDFEAISGLAGRIEFVQSLAGNKPVMLTEIGHSRWPALPGRLPQADKLSAQLQTLGGLEGVLVWTLNDFHRIPNEVAGWRPWRKAMQAHYGLSPQSRAQFARFLCDFLKSSNQTCTGVSP